MKELSQYDVLSSSTTPELSFPCSLLLVLKQILPLRNHHPFANPLQPSSCMSLVQMLSSFNSSMLI